MLFIAQFFRIKKEKPTIGVESVRFGNITQRNSVIVRCVVIIKIGILYKRLENIPSEFDIGFHRLLIDKVRHSLP